MARYIIRRILQLVPTLIALLLIIFFSVRLLPGDVTDTLGGEYQNAAAVESIRSSLGLDKPLIQQLGSYFDGLLHGDLGASLVYGTPVWHLVTEAYPRTLTLAALALTLATVLGVSIGVLAAARPNGILDFTSMTVALAGAAIPVFWLGLVLVSIFAVSLKWLPAGGIGGLSSYILPTLTLGLPGAGIIARMTRSGMLEVLRSEYTMTARSKGISERRILIRYALRNSLLPVVTAISLLGGSMLGGSVVVETIFTWPGMGHLLIGAVQNRDYPMIEGTLLLYGLTYVLLNFGVDLLYAALDPRIEYV
jgi:ABC-type dipeptide/oligopeptide/nickel transport system permease component